MIRSLRALALLSFLIFSAFQIRAQVPTGTPPFGSFGGGPDVIDLANLNSHITIPVLHKAGRGTNFTYDLSYDTSVWYPITSGSTKVWQPVLNFGWRGITEIATGYISYNTWTGSCYDDAHILRHFTVRDTWFYHDPFGTEHNFPNVILVFDSFGCSGLTSVNSDSAEDGSGYVISNAVNTGATVSSSTGAAFHVLANSTSGAASFADRNGNEITADGNGNFYDTLSSTTPVLSVSGSGTSTSALIFSYTAPSGAAASYTMNFTNYTVATNFGVSEISEYKSSAAVPLVSSIQLPDGSKYIFNYEPTPSTPVSGACTPYAGTTCTTARVTSVTLPTGGTTTYTYTGGNNGIFTEGSAATLTRTTPDGSWTYAQVKGTGAASTTTITGPQSNQTVIQFQGTYETQRQVYQGSQTSGTLLQTVNTCYNGAAPPCTTTSASLPITQRAESVQLDLGSLQGYTLSKWNSNGVLTEVDSYSYGSGAAGPLLKKTLYSYASLGNITALRQTVQATDANNNVISQTNSNYDETSVTTTSGVPQHASVSGSRGNLTSVQSCTVLPSCSSYLTSKATYDDTGQALTATDSNNNATSFSYADSFYTDNGANPPQAYTPSAPTNAYVTKVTVPILGASATYGYYFYTGQTAVSKDQNGADSYSHYDSIGRPTTDYLPPRPDGNRGWTLSQYPSVTEIDSYTSITSTSPSSSCTSCRHQQANYDSSGRVTSDVLVNDPDGLTTVATGYDSLGRVASTTNPYRRTSDPTYGVVTPTYDALGRVVKVTAADGSITYEYYGAAVASAGGASAQLCSSATYGYGYPVLIVDASGKKRQRWSDGLGRVFEIDEADQNGNMAIATCSSFDLSNNLTQVVQGAQTRSYTYDALSRLTSATTPEAGTVNTYYTTASGTLCSGNPALVCRRTDARGITTTNTYDALNRLTNVAYSDGTAQVQYFYDQTAYNGLTITNGKGRLAGMSDASGTSAYSYDLLGQILTENHTISGVTKSISYSYNLDGSMASITYPSGRIVSYAYSNAQRPLSALDSVSSNYYAKSAVYAPQGTQANVLYGYTSSFGGITESYTYSNRLQLKNQTASSSNGVALNLNYGFPSSPGNNARVTAIVNNVDNGRTQNISYDTLNRISSAQSQATSGADCWGQSYGYDRWANLLSINLTQCSGGTLSVLTTNNHITNTGFNYDAAGNMTGDGINTYMYDAANHLTSAAGVTYTYDARDLRVKKSSGTVYWRGFLGDAFAESDLSGNIQNEYIFFGGQRTARVNSGGNVYYYFADRLGSTRAITGSNGTVCYNADFTPFGSELQFTNTCSQNYKFTGYERDPETGLDYAVYRHYSSRLGRFLQPDPLAGHLTNPQSLNRYTYVMNDPLNWTDHMGLSPCPVGTHPANATEAAAVVTAAQQFLNQRINYGTGITYGSDGKITAIDCSNLVAKVASIAAGYTVPVVTASNIYDGNAPNLVESSENGQVGDIVAFGGGYHVGIVTSTAPFGYIASNGVVEQGKTAAPRYGPGNAPRSAFNDDPTKRRFYTLCIKDKAAKPGNSGGGGSSPGFSIVEWLMDLVVSIPPPPPPPPAPSTSQSTVSVTVSMCGNGTCTLLPTTDSGTQGPAGTDNGNTDNGANDGSGTDSAGGNTAGDSSGGGGGGDAAGDPVPFDGPMDETLVLPLCDFTGVGSCRQTYVRAKLHHRDWRRELAISPRAKKKDSMYRLVLTRQTLKPQLVKDDNSSHWFLAASEKTTSGGMWQPPRRSVKMIRAHHRLQSTVGNTLCYAFLQAGDLWTVCDGKRERIRVPSKIYEFAISTDGNYLAYYTRKIRPDGSFLPRQDLILVALTQGFKTIRKEAGVKPENLLATCGTILKYSNQDNATTPLIEGGPPDLPSRGFLQCSSDRRIIATWVRPAGTNQGDVIVTMNGKEIHRLPKVGADFGISPMGAHLAYDAQVDDKFQDCITEPAGSPSCTLDVGNNNRNIQSVSDSGEVLYGVELENEFCGQFACTGVEYRRPGKSSGEILERHDTFGAQWITPQVATRLHEWASTVTSPPR